MAAKKSSKKKAAKKKPAKKKSGGAKGLMNKNQSKQLKKIGMYD